MLEPAPRDLPAPPDSTAEIARGAFAGDQEKFRKLYERIAPTLYAWSHLRIQGALRQVIDPEELMQEVWMRAVRNFRTFGASGASFRGWILGIARNVLLEGMRRLHPVLNPRGSAAGVDSLLGVDDCPDSVTTITTRLARDEGLQRFFEYVDALEPEDRKILIHCGLEELTCGEAATRLGLSADAAAKRWQRLRGKLRESGVGRDLLLTGVD